MEGLLGLRKSVPVCMRGKELENAPLALGLSRTIMVAVVVVAESWVFCEAHPCLAPNSAVPVESQVVNAWGGPGAMVSPVSVLVC